jgi:hypothetical protein
LEEEEKRCLYNQYTSKAVLSPTLPVLAFISCTKSSIAKKTSVKETADSFLIENPTSGLSNAAPVISFFGALIFSAGFDVNQNVKKILFLNNSMFKFFRSTPMNTVFPLLQTCFLLYPFYCPLTPPFPFSLAKALASQVIPSNK